MRFSHAGSAVKTPVIAWFRRNLRLTDNEPLRVALATGQPLVAVYVHDPAHPVGGASAWWLHHSLAGLDRALRGLGGSLIIRRGDSASELCELVARTGADHVTYARRYEPFARREEDALRAQLPEHVSVTGCDDGVLSPPHRVMTRTGTRYKVFTPYWKAAVALGEPPLPQPAPAAIAFAEVDHSLHVDELRLLPTAPDWSQGLQATWHPGEDGALTQLDVAAAGAHAYASQRDRPDLDVTSRLSPHLHFGEVSPRQAWHALRSVASNSSGSQGAEALIRQLYWREFSTYLLFHFPRLPEEPLRPEFEHFPWTNDSTALEAWQTGTTGYPLIDAGMRQLWQTGWMHNRVRMIAASFLVKNLMIDWQTGADWFLDTLVDADLANNSAGWQWVAGCGTDAAPYFRIFNPILQSAKFDPEGNYIRRFVPELSELPTGTIHEPWKADGMTLEPANMRIGVDYPAPIVDLGDSRKRALEAYRHVRGMLQSGPDRPGSSAG